jgi:hypothetical protein
MLMRKTCRTLIAAALLSAGVASQASVVTLDPYLPAGTPTSSGANAQFIRIANDWHGSTVPYDDATGTYGTGPAIGTYGWGAGLWGIADFNTVLGGGVTPVASWTGSVSSINFGDGCYNDLYGSSSWGPAQLAPFFSSGVGCESTEQQSDAANEQDNWISYFSGYIRISDEDIYNFSVLNDDGFFFNLYGAGGSPQSISLDYLNPRNRLCFGDDTGTPAVECNNDYFALSPGLYRFELGAYDRLQAGVVDLRWRHGDGTDWTLVPTENLATIPEPATIALFATGLGALLLVMRRRMRVAPAASEQHGA